MKSIYRSSFHRTVRNGKIKYRGFEYTSPELLNLEGKRVELTKFGDEPGTFCISSLLVSSVSFNNGSSFWVSQSFGYSN